MVPGSVHIEGYSWHKANSIYQQVYDFSHRELIGVLSRCVECNKVPRDQLDAQTAREIIDRRNQSDPVICRMGARLITLKAYQIERIDRNGSLRPIGREIIDSPQGGNSCYVDIMSFLGTLSREHSIYLMDRAAAEVSWDHNFTGLVLGRCVWDWLYQPEKTNLPDGYGELLSPS